MSHQETYIFQKIEKIASAIYLLAGYLSEKEPLRDELRKESLKLVDCLFGGGAPDRLSPSLIVQLNRVTALLSVAESAGVLSSMNVSILRSELTRIREVVTEERNLVEGSTSLHPELKESYFSLGEIESLRNPESRKALPSRFSKDGRDTGDPREESYNGHSNGQKKKKTKKSKNGRRQKILSLFETQDEITINDVEEIIEGCSRKTMQRELLSLVDEGILSKEGEKRWSTYRLRQ